MYRPASPALPVLRLRYSLLLPLGRRTLTCGIWLRRSVLAAGHDHASRRRLRRTRLNGRFGRWHSASARHLDRVGSRLGNVDTLLDLVEVYRRLLLRVGL